MAREVLHRVIGARLVAVGRGDYGTRVVRHDQLGHPTVEVQRTHHALDPVVQALRRRRAGEHVAGGGHGRDEDLRACPIAQRHRRSREVHEQFLAGAPVLPHGSLQGRGKGLVVLAELRVSPRTALGVGGHVLLPQQRERDAFAVQLSMDAGPVGHHHRLRGYRAWLQGLRERLLAQALGALPVETGRFGQRDVLGDDALGDLQGGGNLRVRQLRVPLQADDIFDHA